MKKFLSICVLLLMSALACNANDMRFVQVTDVRYNSKENNEAFAKTIQDINKQKDVKFVVFTGDNINKPDKEDLAAFLKEAKKLNCPFYMVIGDKDVNKHREMSKKQYIKEIQHHMRKYKFEHPNYVFEREGIAFIVVDGSKDVIPGTNGYFKEDVLQWLETQLNKHNKQNVIILQHFPIVPPAEKETYYTYKPENYLKILHNNKNIKAVISGHFGVNKEQNVDGVAHISTSPIPYYRIIDVIDCDTPNPVIWAELKEVK